MYKKLNDATTSTRQRLLDLWEKCPECRLGRCKRVGRSWRVSDESRLAGYEIPEPMVFALARDAMVRCLAGKAPGVYISYEPNDDVWCVGSYAAGGNAAADTLIDALISAVEAVLGDTNETSNT